MKRSAFKVRILMIGVCFLLCGCTGRTERFLYEEAEITGTPESGTVPAQAEETAEDAAPDPEPEEQTHEDEEQAAQIFVDVCGAVLSPGVYILPEGSRVYSAIEAAGGFLEDAASETVNQAGILFDTQQIYIPTKDEAAGESPVYLSAGAGEENASPEPDDGKIDLNTADAGQLCSLPGIGEAKAEAILAYRDQYGPFSSPDELMNVSGIKEGTYAKIKEKVLVR